MSIISLRPGEEGRILVELPYKPAWVAKIKTVQGRCWHPELKCWSIPYSEEAVGNFLSLFQDGIVELDPVLRTEKEPLRDLRRELVARRYSPRTIKSYLHYNKEFLKITRKEPKEIRNEDVKDYLVHLVEKKNISTSTLNIVISALKFYYGEVRKQSFIYDIKRPSKDKKLPIVLNEDEIVKLISVVDNLKHRTILMLVYSSGLRVSEVVKLKREDLDFKRSLIHIKGAKGRKDRYTLFSDVAQKTLKMYIRSFNSENWLFPGKKKRISYINEDRSADIFRRG